jgi:hypothetical protein
MAGAEHEHEHAFALTGDLARDSFAAAYMALFSFTIVT